MNLNDPCFIWLFPAGAGMNRGQPISGQLFPAGAGMNRLTHRLRSAVPRRRGDEPVSVSYY